MPLAGQSNATDGNVGQCAIHDRDALAVDDTLNVHGLVFDEPGAEALMESLGQLVSQVPRRTGRNIGENRAAEIVDPGLSSFGGMEIDHDPCKL